jgi:PAS domain S-box-containing protein
MSGLRAVKPLGVCQRMSSTRIPREIGAPTRSGGGLTESEARFIRLAENTSDVVYRYRYKPTRGFEYVNPAVTALSGFTPEEAYADPDLSMAVVHPEDRPLLESSMCDPASMAAPLTFRIVHKNGGIVWVERRVIPILDEAGEIVAVEGIVRDITQRVLTQQTLERLVEERTREIERRRQVAHGMRETLAVLNSDRPITDILDHIVGQAIRLLAADAAAVFQLDPSEQTLRIRSAQGLDPDYVAHMVIPVGRGPLGEAVLHRRPVPVPDLLGTFLEISDRMDPHKRTLLARLANQYRALFAVPLIVKAEVYGGLVVYYTAPRQFSDEETSLTVALADQAALAIENARLREHLQEAAAAAERDRLARDLHDSVTQSLFSVNLIAGVLPRLWERAPEEARRRLEDLRQLARGALAEMRALLLELRPAALLEMGLGDLLQQLADATAGRGRLPVVVTVDGEGTLPPDVQIALYRIAQEAVNNATKHAGASRCTVAVDRSSDGVRLTISDDGRGFDPAQAARAHLGLSIMQERAAAIGAALTVNSDVGRGTTVAVAWTARAGAEA